MRIGIDTTSLPAEPVGAGTYIIQLVRALAELNTSHQFFVFTHRSRLALFEIAPANNLEWILVADKPPFLRLVWEQIALPSLVNKFQLDLLHSLHYTSPFRLSCASVVTFHDMTFFLYPKYHTFPKRLFFPSMIRSSAKRADALIVVSETTRRDTIDTLKVPEDRVFTTHHGVSTVYHPIADRALLESGRKKLSLPEKFILFVGTIEPRKNVPLLLKAFHVLAQEDISLQLVIAGKLGWMHQQVWDTIKELHLESQVHHIGYVPSSDLPIIYNLAKVFVYPSTYEGFGLPPLEAMACGTPVIASNIPAIQEHVGEAGLLFQPHDEEALTRALRQVLTNPELCSDLSRKGLERSRHFTWRRCAQATVEVYQGLLTP